MPLKLISLFDGSGTMPLVASVCGITPISASEVEPYPVAVTTARFPNMKHLGSVTEINGAEIEPADIIAGGSPCQNLSVAGNRDGLFGDRSVLFLEFVRIIREMRIATNGAYPRYAVWENVPGALSCNGGEDFRCVLAEFIGIKDKAAVVPDVPGAGWANADEWRGDGWSLAYRILDSQYFGVPQRRKRIYLVADFAGHSAGRVLFEPEGVCRNIAACGKARQDTPSRSFGSPESNDRAGCLTPWDGQARRVYSCDGVAPSLPCRESSGQNQQSVLVPLYNRPQVYDARGNGDGNTVNTLTGDHQNRVTDYTAIVCEPESAGDTVREAYSIGNGQVHDLYLSDKARTLHCMHDPQAVVTSNPDQKYAVRRLTPTECGRLQGFPDGWADIPQYDSFTDEQYGFWLNVRKTHDTINGRKTKDYTRAQMLKWYNRLHTDSAEYKMWGNGMAAPCALFVMQGVAENCTQTGE